MPRTILKAGSILLACASGLPAAAASAEAAKDVLVRAFEKEGAAPRKRVELDFKRGDREMHYLILRVLPDRLYFVVAAGGKTQEIYVIGSRLYTMTATGWRDEPAPARIDAASIAVDLSPAFGALAEQQGTTLDGRAQRVFSSHASWQMGGDWNEGQLEIVVDARKTLPSRIEFSGRCGADPCSFVQSIRYDDSLTIEPPGLDPVKGLALSFVEEHNRVWSEANAVALAKLAPMYASRVTFYGSHWSRDRVMAEKREFANRWPVRSYHFLPNVEASRCDASNACVVVGLVEWHANDPARGATSTGTAEVTIGLQALGDTFSIVSEDGHVLSRQ